MSMSMNVPFNAQIPYKQVERIMYVSAITHTVASQEFK